MPQVEHVSGPGSRRLFLQFDIWARLLSVCARLVEHARPGSLEAKRCQSMLATSVSIADMACRACNCRSVYGNTSGNQM